MCSGGLCAGCAQCDVCHAPTHVEEEAKVSSLHGKGQVSVLGWVGEGW